jgi:hypothetical protein
MRIRRQISGLLLESLQFDSEDGSMLVQPSPLGISFENWKLLIWNRDGAVALCCAPFLDYH